MAMEEELNQVDRLVLQILQRHVVVYEGEFIRPILAELKRLEHEVVAEYAAAGDARKDPRCRDQFALNIKRIHQTRMFLEDRHAAVKRNPANCF